MMKNPDIEKVFPRVYKESFEDYLSGFRKRAAADEP